MRLTPYQHRSTLLCCAAGAVMLLAVMAPRSMASTGQLVLTVVDKGTVKPVARGGGIDLTARDFCGRPTTQFRLIGK